MPLSQYRTKWPVNGGAIAVQPGWFTGHSLALIYVNIGIQGPGDLNPPNMSHPVVPPFQIVGPNNSYYGGEFCLPQIGMPANLSLQIGDNITIQVIETAQHGAALYTVSTIHSPTVLSSGKLRQRLTCVPVCRRHPSGPVRGRRGELKQLQERLGHQLQPALHQPSSHLRRDDFAHEPAHLHNHAHHRDPGLGGRGDVLDLTARIRQNVRHFFPIKRLDRWTRSLLPGGPPTANGDTPFAFLLCI